MICLSFDLDASLACARFSTIHFSTWYHTHVVVECWGGEPGTPRSCMLEQMEDFVCLLLLFPLSLGRLWSQFGLENRVQWEEL